MLNGKRLSVMEDKTIQKKEKKRNLAHPHFQNSRKHFNKGQDKTLWGHDICVHILSKVAFCRVSIEFSFYLNLDLLLKIEAAYSITRIIKSGCNLIARKRLTFIKIL